MNNLIEKINLIQKRWVITTCIFTLILIAVDYIITMKIFPSQYEGPHGYEIGLCGAIVIITTTLMAKQFRSIIEK